MVPRPDAVSYTHLDVYKRQVTAFVSPIRKLANFAEMFSNGFAGLHRFIELMATEPSIQDAPDAVSYTHLDVYKRQVLHGITSFEAWDNGAIIM